MTGIQGLELARVAFARRDWATAREHFCRADDLTVDDLAALATSCWWLGFIDDSIAAYTELHRLLLRADVTARAGLTAVVVAYCELVRGQVEDGMAWLARARRLLDQVPDAPERGYLLGVDAEMALMSGDFDAADASAVRVLELADLHEEPTLQAHGLFARGVVAIRRGRVEEGQRYLDEAMLPVRAGEVAPQWAGNLYCRMIQLCHELADLPRARRWTTLTEQWCGDFLPAVVFTGVCRVHRVQLMQVEGEWARAAAEAERAVAELAELDVTVAAEAHYRLGEVHRLQGDLDAAEAAYREAHRLGRDPLPGLALLHLFRGRGRVAASVLDAALAAESTPLGRAPLLAARAEVALAADDTDRAAACVSELSAVAEQHASPGWRAEALRWRGATLLLAGRPADALAELREARRLWQQFDAPYRVTLIRLDIADACAALGDHDTAERERDQADSVLEQLGAHRDLTRLRTSRHRRRTHEVLSPRELEVVAAIAQGGANREAADRLHISERTVARHLANVYRKTEVSSRTGAVAWARDRGLL